MMRMPLFASIYALSVFPAINDIRSISYSSFPNNARVPQTFALINNPNTNPRDKNYALIHTNDAPDFPNLRRCFIFPK